MATSRSVPGHSAGYPVTLERDANGTILVSFPDFPEAHTFGADVEEALRRAPDALRTIIETYINDRRPIPLPSAIATEHRITVPNHLARTIKNYRRQSE
jgi:antitoxin HicB